MYALPKRFPDLVELRPVHLGGQNPIVNIQETLPPGLEGDVLGRDLEKRTGEMC